MQEGNVLFSGNYNNEQKGSSFPVRSKPLAHNGHWLSFYNPFNSRFGRKREYQQGVAVYPAGEISFTKQL